MKEEKNKEVGVYLTKEEYEKFEEIRWRERKKRTEIGREALLEYIKNHTEGNSQFKIEQFQDPSFQAVPAYYADKESIINHYKNSDEKDKTKLRIRALEYNKWYRMVDTNK